MKVFKLFSALVLVVLLAAVPVRAQEVKIAYCDIARVFDEYTKTKEYDKVLEADAKKFEEERNKKIEQIREMQGKQAVLKDDEKTKLDTEMEKLKNEIIEFDRAKRTDLAKQRDEKVREIILEIEKIVSDQAKAAGFTFVLNQRMLVYGVENLNITDQVLKALNDSYKPKN